MVLQTEFLKVGAFLLMIASSTSDQKDRVANSCNSYKWKMRQVNKDIALSDAYNYFLEQIGFLKQHSVFGVDDYDECADIQVHNAKIHTAGAQRFKKENNLSAEEYESLARRCKDFGNFSNNCMQMSAATVHPKYRSIDGRGNNLKNPNWGASNTPFSRFGSKNYEDGIYEIKKSVTGSDLPTARLIVEEVLTKAVRTRPSSTLTYNTLATLIILFVTHDLHHQVPMQPNSADKEILCCQHDRRNTLPSFLSNSACLPIEIHKNDSFYKNGKIGCLNMVRSQIGGFDVQAGEILNQATAYMDLSLIYGHHESETNQIRLFEGGKLRVGKNSILPVDSKGKYLKPMYRFIAIPMASIFPAIFIRNHNHLAKRLSALNPHWTDEIIFQEARRINIANFQYNLINAKSIEKVFERPVNEKYSNSRNAGTFIEFPFTYRGTHFYLQEEMEFRNENYTITKKVRHSDAIGRIDLLEKNFEDAIRGVSCQFPNVGQYSDEILHRIEKDKNGYGTDLISTDIQRSRDHGIPSFVEIRKKCKLTPEINSFDDFKLIFNPKNVDLLKKVYKSYKDVEFYVGGMLEAFESVGDPLAGPTFGCIIGENYNNVMGGDIYYYSHPENPYPMTKEQIVAIEKYSFPNLFCTNSALKETLKFWSYAPHAMNPNVDCKNYPPMDFCNSYKLVMWRANNDIALSDAYNNVLEQIGFVTPHSVFGVDDYDECADIQVHNAKIHTVGAQKFKKENNLSVEEYESLARHCKDYGNFPNNCMQMSAATVHPKYRPINGRGNNLKNPNWGMSNTPFSRFGSRNYEDGIYEIKKSVTGSDLPNARLIVEEVLTKAVRSEPPSLMLNTLAILAVLFATHDLHYQVPMQPKSGDKEILCCQHDRRNTLPSSLSNSACLPIEIHKNDSFYKNGKIGCLNMVRSQIGEFDAQAGEILNQATSYLDLSLIYGNHESETNQIRLFEGGKFRMGKNNVLPVDSKGKYLKSMYRFIAVPIASILPSIFARNHNDLATRLAKLNPHWTDETIFQEARRINIANFQYNLITAKTIERVFHKPVNESYSDLRNAGTSIEFAISYRAAHYYLQGEMEFRNENYTITKKVRHSDAINHIDLLENNYEDACRGVVFQPVNVGPYSDEILNRIAKDGNGYGTDLVSIDIQRARDHGVPSFVEIRKKCKLTPEINSFDDFKLIIDPKNVDLLKKVYKSYKDVEFYVGGILELFASVANPLAGPTFGCVIGENYRNTMGGDIYFFTHPENPHPMTTAQIDAISKYSFSNLLCTNIGYKETLKLWAYTPHPVNPTVDCKYFPPMDLSAWEESIGTTN
ncbi:Peroxidase [Pseudolycoriella hygida]|uniref:peroxidase n=1 Tax=Pseudolycoriella hygida TaxID=35572 RepID=A0A9Q0S978_9DIPT|nr:Peroxidase [Pseudolycoriella hygida]